MNYVPDGNSSSLYILRRVFLRCNTAFLTPARFEHVIRRRGRNFTELHSLSSSRPVSPGFQFPSFNHQHAVSSWMTRGPNFVEIKSAFPAAAALMPPAGFALRKRESRHVSQHAMCVNHLHGERMHATAACNNTVARSKLF